MSYITVDYDAAYATADTVASVAREVLAALGGEACPELEAYAGELTALAELIRRETDEYRALDMKMVELGRIERGQ